MSENPNGHNSLSTTMVQFLVRISGSQSLFRSASQFRMLYPDKLVELKLTVEKVQTAVAECDRSGLRFVKMISFTVTETITTDRILVTDEAVRCLNPPSI
jgi:hypothetical protein